MGKKAKEHRKKVAARNLMIKANEKKMQKMYQEMFNKQMAELQQKIESGMTIDANGQSVPFEVVGESQLPTV
jgi:anti-sigma28 factor (negative regulator of flagellin synthesis)